MARSFFQEGDHTICLDEISHWGTRDRCLVVSMRNGEKVVWRSAVDKSCYDIERRLIEVIKLVGR